MLTFFFYIQWTYYRWNNNMILNVSRELRKKSESQMGFEPTTLLDLVGCSNHWELYWRPGPICGSWLELHTSSKSNKISFAIESRWRSEVDFPEYMQLLEFRLIPLPTCCFPLHTRNINKLIKNSRPNNCHQGCPKPLQGYFCQFFSFFNLIKFII